LKQTTTIYCSEYCTCNGLFQAARLSLVKHTRLHVKMK